MTRKRFWGLRNATMVALFAWAKANGMGPSGRLFASLRPVSGEPLVDFKNGKKYGYGKSYDEIWNSEASRDFRKSLGMEV